MKMSQLLIAFLIVLTAVLTAALSGCTRHTSQPAPPSKDSLNMNTQLVTTQIKLTTAHDSTLTGQDSTRTYGTSDTVHALIRTDNAAQGMKLLGIWSYAKTGDRVAANAATLQQGSDVTHLDLVNNRSWLQGVYKLVVYIDSVPKDSIRFTIADKH